MRLFLFSISLILFFSCSLVSKKSLSKKQVVLVSTNLGSFKLKLYDDTPIHKANFLALVDSGFYDSLLFHRVIREFMVQGGDPSSKNAPTSKMLGEGGPGYQIKAEILPNHIHKKGVIAAARQGDSGNPQRKSSGSQFYIVTGRVYSKSNLAEMEKSIDHGKKVGHLQRLMQTEDYREANKWLQYCRSARLDYKYDSIIHSFDPVLDAYLDSVGHFKFTDRQITAYSSVGGTPHLDGAYSVFGEITAGMDVVSNIENMGCDYNNRPKVGVIIIGMKRVKE